MKYIEQQRLKALSLVGSMFNDPCGGRFLGKEREFVLKNGRLKTKTQTIPQTILRQPYVFLDLIQKTQDH